MSRQRATLSLLKYCLKPRMGLFWIAMVLLLLFTLVDLAFPKILQLYIDAISGKPLNFLGLDLTPWNTDRARIYFLPGMLLASALLRWGLTYLRTVYQNRLGQGVMLDLRQRIYETIQQLSFSYHDRSHSGTLIANIVEDVRFATQFLDNGIFPLIEAAFYIPIVYFVMFLLCWPAALASLLLLLASLVVVFFVYKFGYPVFMRTKDLFSRMVQIFSENIEGHLVVRAYGRHAAQRNLYEATVGDLHRSFFREVQIGLAANQSMFFASTFGIFAVLGLAIYAGRHMNFEMTGGWLLFLFFLQTSLVNRVRMLGRGMDLLIRFMISTERLEQLFGAKDYIEDKGKPGLPFPSFNTLEARNLGFAYGRREFVLKNVDLKMASGETLALVGATGAGKTTLIHLLCRFYDPGEGELWLDDQPIKDFSTSELRKVISIVFQETFLFSESVSANIAYGHPGAGEEEILAAAKLAQAHDFISAMPRGYDTKLGEKGLTLSGGQRQRIGIARALLRRPKLLILDDCTSALDTRTERAILDGLRRQNVPMMTILISHRHSTVEQADRVLVLDEGRIVENDSPMELNRPGTAFSRILHSRVQP